MKEIQTTTDYPQPAETMIDNIRQRLDQGPAGLVERVDKALRLQSLEHVRNFLSKTGCPFSSDELCEYRKTLFPPNAMLDPYTAGPPVLRDRSADSLSASDLPPGTGPSEISNVKCEIPLPAVPTTDNGPLTTDNKQLITDHSPPPTDDCSLITPSPGSALLSALRDLLNRYVVLPEMAAETLALWVVHTYAFTLRQVTTYIGVVSPEKRCGKTTLLELLGRLANRSLTSANISSSAMFRVIEDTQPTLLIDEADTFLEGRDELAGILNAGYRKGNSYVVRVADRKARRNENKNVGGTSYTSPINPENTSVGGTSYTSPQSNDAKPEFAQWTPDLGPQSSDVRPPSSDFARYSCWCPKVMAAIGRLPDTLADRCILITMQRKMPGEKCERMRHLNAEDLRKRCDEFVRTHSDHIAHAQPAIPSTLNDRAADIWEPLLAIADLAGGEWPQLARAAAQKLSTHDDELTPTGYFLKDLRNLMVLAGVDRMLCRDIVKHLNPMHNRPWEDLRRGREINEWWLGRLLGELGIQSRSTRVGDATGKGYTLADIDAAFRRYVPNPDLHTTLPPPENSLDRGSASRSSTNPETDAQTEKDILKLMQQLMAQPKPS